MSIFSFYRRMFYDLPQEIQGEIFQFDPMKREMWDRVIHEIQMIPVMDQLKSKIYFHQSWYPDRWWFGFLNWYKKCGSKPNPNQAMIALIRQARWKIHWNQKLKSSYSLV